MPEMIDSHAHLYLKEFDPDRQAVIERARAAGIEAIVNVGIDVPTSREALELARGNSGLYATAGLHPTTPVADLDRSLEEIRGIIRSEPSRVVAVGEIGLDYYWKEVEPADQKVKLRAQLDLALELGLPVVIHCRDALGDLLGLFEAAPAVPAGVFHCFQGKREEARRALALGFHLSFTGIVTYPRSDELRAAAREVPLDRILLETDSPYLPPQGKRGQRNEPSFALLTRDALARLHGIEPADLGRRAAENTRRLFRLEDGRPSGLDS